MKLNIAVCVVLAFCGIQSTIGYTLRELQEVQLSLKPFIKGIYAELKNATYQNKYLAETEVNSLKQEGIQKVMSLLDGALVVVTKMGQLAEARGVSKDQVSTCHTVADGLLQHIDLNKHDEFENIESVAHGLINGYVEKLKDVDDAKKFLLEEVDAGIESCALDNELELCEKNVQSVTAAYRKYHDESLEHEKEIKASLEIPVKTAKSLNENTVKSTQKEISHMKHVYEKCLKST